MTMNEFSHPILIYDNLCYSCTKYAKIVQNVIDGKCLIVGHYTQLGKEIKKKLFPTDYEGLEMSWFIIDGIAYGGRSGLFRLIKFILFESKPGDSIDNVFDLTQCSTACKSRKISAQRLFNIFLMHKKFAITNSI